MADIIAETLGRGAPQPLIQSMKKSLAQRTPREWEVFQAHVAEFRSFGSAADHVDFAKLEAKTLWLNGMEDEIVNQLPVLVELIGAFLLDRPYAEGIPDVSFVHGRRAPARAAQ